MGYESAKIEVGSLRYRLKHGTKEIHDVADKSMQSFLFGEVAATQSREAYRHFLLQLYVLYEALEEELEANAEHPIVGPIYFPDELNRLRFLEEDLDYYYSNRWRHLLDTEITRGMQRYVARIRDIGKTQPALLVAHSYTRYLGDMSGGQILRRMIKNRYSLRGEDGVSFYKFDHVESIAKFKDLFSSRMNATRLDEQGMCDQVEEAKRIFQFNIDVFDEISAMFNTDNGLLSATQLTAHESVHKDLGQWQTVATVASVTVGVSATIMMLCPWFRSIVLK